MEPKTHATLLNTLTEYDRKQSKKQGYSIYALTHYCKALNNVQRYVTAGHDLRDAIITCFLGKLADKFLKSVNLQLMTDNEAKFGLHNKLPELTELTELTTEDDEIEDEDGF